MGISVDNLWINQTFSIRIPPLPICPDDFSFSPHLSTFLNNSKVLYFFRTYLSYQHINSINIIINSFIINISLNYYMKDLEVCL